MVAKTYKEPETLRDRLVLEYRTARLAAKKSPWLCSLGAGAILENACHQFLHIDAETVVVTATKQHPLPVKWVIDHAEDSSWIDKSVAESIRCILDNTNSLRHRGTRPSYTDAITTLTEAYRLMYTLQAVALKVEPCLGCSKTVRLPNEKLLEVKISHVSRFVWPKCTHCKRSLRFTDFRLWQDRVSVCRN